jgi:hypothetical protein
MELLITFASLRDSGTCDGRLVASGPAVSGYVMRLMRVPQSHGPNERGQATQQCWVAASLDAIWIGQTKEPRRHVFRDESQKNTQWWFARR